MSPAQEQIDQLYSKLKTEAEEGGYHLNPDATFTKNLISGLLTNQTRFGYQSCPCRLATGSIDDDLDIVCPCDYTDPDIAEFGTCYWALYVNEEISSGKKQASSIPERRPTKEQRQKQRTPNTQVEKRSTSLPYPIWRCKVCGYLCSRETPPEKCPICKVGKERFEKYTI